jgi:transposase
MPRMPRPPKSKKSAKTGTLHVTNRHAAGVDIHLATHWVAVPLKSAPPRSKDHHANLPDNVRTFGTCTADLEMLADWLTACGITTVAMEATGVYWIPLFELLERRGFTTILVDPRQTKHAPGRPKSDKLDCQWIQRLHSYGLLTASFRPDDPVVVLRSYLRQRQMLTRFGSQHIQHMQKALEQMNVKLGVVVSDITGKTGLAIIKDILRGERNPRLLAKHRHEKCKHSEAEIARALYGNWRDEHLFALEQALAAWQFCQEQLAVCDQRIEACLKTFPDKSTGKTLPAKVRPTARRCHHHVPHFDVRGSLFQMSSVDLTIIEGIDEMSALVILSEIGLDMSKWATEKHFTSWLGLSPQHQGSAGKIKSRHVRRGSNRAARALRLAGQGCHHAKNALGAYYRRIQARCGGPRAVLATARKIAERVYRLLKYGHTYVRQEMTQVEEAYRLRQIRGLARKAQELGFKLEPCLK